MSPSPRLRVLAAIPRAAGPGHDRANGRSDRRRASRPIDDHLALGDELAISSPGTHRVNQLFALVQAGRLAEAEEKGRAWFDVAARGLGCRSA